jgi:hypothetical protein
MRTLIHKELRTSWALRAGSGCAQGRHERRFDFDHVFASDVPQATPTSALPRCIARVLGYHKVSYRVHRWRSAVFHWKKGALGAPGLSSLLKGCLGTRALRRAAMRQAVTAVRAGGGVCATGRGRRRRR